jgi:hypothetical protein
MISPTSWESNPSGSDPRTLQLSKYLSGATPPPPSVNWGTKIHAWGMLGNDTIGDCAWAGQAHADMLWTSNTERTPLGITTEKVLAAYAAVTGFNPHDNGPHGNPTDKGTLLIDALKYWRSTGIDGQTITAFVEVNPKNQEHVMAAIDLFGCVYVGVELPDSVLPSPTTTPPWTVSPNGSEENKPDPSNGHCIIYSAYDASGPTVISWGTTIQASWAFHAAYCDELYAMVAPRWIGRRGFDPQGIDQEALEVDLAALGPSTHR